MPGHLHLLLDGSVSCRSLSGEVREVESPAALGFKEVLEGTQMNESVRATDTAVCMVFSREEFWTLLADDSELVQGLFRMLGCPDEAGPAELVFKGHWEAGGTVVPGRGLKPSDKMLVLKNIPIFSEVNAEEMIGLSSIAVEVPLESGAMLFKEADPPALFALVSGELRLEATQDKSPATAEPYDVIGIQRILAGISLGHRARVVHEGAALRIDGEDLFDLLAQRPDLLRQLLSAVSRARPGKRSATPV